MKTVIIKSLKGHQKTEKNKIQKENQANNKKLF